MIIEDKINGLLFQEQRTYRIYESEQDRTDGNYILCTSDEKKFIESKNLARTHKSQNRETKINEILK